MATPVVGLDEIYISGKGATNKWSLKTYIMLSTTLPFKTSGLMSASAITLVGHLKKRNDVREEGRASFFAGFAITSGWAPLNVTGGISEHPDWVDFDTIWPRIYKTTIRRINRVFVKNPEI